MEHLAFLSDVERYGPLPRIGDPDRVDRLRDDAPGLFDDLAGHAAATRLLEGIAANSPFLTRLIVRHPDGFRAMLTQTPEQGFEVLLSGVGAAAKDAATLPELMAALRHAKERASLLIASADLAGVWGLDQVTEALSGLADAACRAAIDWLLREAHGAGRIILPNPDDPGTGSGLVVLGMGKLGARELNYSSDIDLVVFFDGDVVPVTPGQDPQGVCVAIVRKLVRILQERTGEGYVFRVDLRLRPDAGSTQAAVSLAAAEHYYEELGQNWERAAFIKARQIAGDPAAGHHVFRMLSPFVWRKHLDYAAIEDIHAIKRQIHAHGGHGSIEIEGHNLKLGRGGIREIEFFAQTQQLIGGGRVPELREQRTIDALQALGERGIITGTIVQELAESYRYLRTVEHRLQMVEDEQTHSLPRQSEGIARIAAFMGLSAPLFRNRTQLHLERVARHYAGLFEAEAPLSERSGNLVFTGVEKDPDTLETLRRMGFSTPDTISDTVRGWHHGRIRATRTARAREILTKLMPVLLDALARTNDPDGAFLRFNAFLSGLPGGVQFFSLMQANPQMLRLLAEVLGMAPRFAGVLSRHPGVLDSMLDPGFFTTLHGPRRLSHLHRQAMDTAVDFEEILDISRRFAREQGFRIGVQVLKGMARASAAGAAYSALAEVIIRGLMPFVEEDMADRHGHIPGGAIAVLAMGKLGSRELTATSDLDLILVYDHEGALARSDGARPLEGPQYFARTCQRFINALTAPTAEGQFYDVDMRLRPSGRAGPIATRLEGFESYHRETAWTWEHMALTRARIVAGPADLADKVRQIVRDVLTVRRDPAKVRADAAEMRARMAAESGPSGPWAVKTVRGGLVDLEFIAQTLQLMHGADAPGVLHPNTLVALSRLEEAGHLSPVQARTLMAAARRQHSIAQVLSLTVEGPFDPDRASPALQLCLERATGVSSFDALHQDLIRMQTDVCDLFATLVGDADPSD